MDELYPNVAQEPVRPVEKPMAVWVFGVLNIVVGFYELVRISPGVSRIMTPVFKNPEKITWEGILFFLILVISVGLAIWLIALGVDLLKMKRWARRGSVLYAWIQIVFMVILLGASLISLVTDYETLLEGVRSFINIGNGLVVIQWIYMILLLIFMQTTKVKEAFAAIGG